MSRITENWVESYLYYTNESEPRESYRRWVAISTIASVLERKCWLHWGTETFFPNLYIVLVGPPAARKGTAMKPGKKLLDKLGIAVSADESSRQKLISSLIDAQAMNQDKLGNAIHHCSLTIYSSELTVFLGYDAKDMLSMLCKLYDCEDRYIYDTVSRGREEVPNVWINLIGATTPGQLQASVPEGFVGSGFTSRVIFVFEDDKGRTVIKPELSEEQAHVGEGLLRDLEDIHNIAGEFKVTEEFEKLYTDWRLNAEANSPFTDARLEYYAQRRPTHLFKLSMIYCVARTDDMLITEGDLSQAIATLDQTEANMHRVFSGIGTNPLAAVQSRLLHTLTEKKSLPMTEVAGMFFSDVTNTQLSEAIATLERMGVCTIDPMRGTLIYKEKKK